VGHPLCYWGLTYSYGPFLNKPGVTPNELAYAHEAAVVANQALNSTAWDLSEAAENLIRSSLVRFPNCDKYTLDDAQNYAAFLKGVAGDDIDMLTMYAEAEMDVLSLRGGGYYTLNGEMNPGEPRDEASRAMEALEKVIEGADDRGPHPQALHLYIHVTEPLAPGDGAAKGENSASILSHLNITDSGHLLHMPGHLFMRVGRYDDVVQSNVLAHKADDLYENNGMIPYGPAHNTYFLVAAAALDGQSSVAIEYSKIIRDVYLHNPDMKDSPGVEEGWNTLLTMYLRFGLWKEVLNDVDWRVPAVFGLGTDNNYGDYLGRYCRGHAHFQLGDTESAQKELEAMEGMTLDDKFEARAKVALLSLKARLVGGEDGLELLKEATEEQNGWEYNSPPHFIQPMNQCLSAYLLNIGREDDAAGAASMDLAEFPNNGWGLYAMYLATGEEEWKYKANEAWERSDNVLESPCLLWGES